MKPTRVRTFANPSLLRALICSSIVAWSFLSSHEISAHQCEWLLSRLKQSSHLDSNGRSKVSTDFWSQTKKRTPRVFSDWAAESNPTFIHGLPTFESRPTEKGFTDWVLAFGRENRLNPELILEAERQIRLASAEFSQAMKDLRANPSEELEDKISLLASKAQYFREMYESLKGENLPYFEQGQAALSKFLDQQGGGSDQHLLEAHIRLWEAESKLNPVFRIDQSSLVEQLPLLNQINFYKDLIQTLTQNIEAKNARFSESLMSKTRLP